MAYAQNEIQIKAHFSPENDSVSVRQTIIFKNSSAVQLSRIYLQDWNNSYSDNATPLAVRFAEEFNPKFHFSKNKDKGKTLLQSIVSDQGTSFQKARKSDRYYRINAGASFGKRSFYTFRS
jgi:hypothetical protein